MSLLPSQSLLVADENVLDPDFLSFLESLSAPVVKPDVTTLRTYPCPPPHSRLLTPFDPIAPTEPYDKHQSTPLLDFLKEQRTAKRGADAGKDASRTRREREREKLDKKRGAGGDKSSGTGKQQPQQARLTTPSVAPSVVPGQVKIAKRPAGGVGEEPSRDARGQKKAGAVPDAGKRTEGKVQVKAISGQGQGQVAASTGQGGKGKPAATRGNVGNGKPPKGDAAGKQVEKPRSTNGTRSATSQPVNAPTTAPTQTKQRPPRGPANLLAAALKSTTRDHPARPDEAKPVRNRPAKGNGPSEAATQGATGEASPTVAGAGEKGKRPPRNRGRKAGGDAAQGKAGDPTAAAHVARIDA